MADFSFSSLRETETIVVGGHDSHVASDEKGSASSVFEVRCDVFAHFSAVAAKKKVTVVCGIGCLVCQDEFFVNNPLEVKKL
jgi:hypothetical protein